MTTSTKRALSGTKAPIIKEGTRTRKQTEKGKYNARNQKKKKTPKRIAKGSESEESSEEESRRPQKKRSKHTEDTDSEEVGHNASNVEDIVEVTSGNGSDSDSQVSGIHYFGLGNILTCKGKGH
jgi:hypothetical protein